MPYYRMKVVEERVFYVDVLAPAKVLKYAAQTAVDTYKTDGMLVSTSAYATREMELPEGSKPCHCCGKISTN